MPTIYFVSDFSYNPQSETLLKIFELGDAFLSAYPEKEFGKENKCVSEYFFDYLKNHYPNALFIQVYPGGLNITDFTDDSEISTYAKNNVMNDSSEHYSPSFDQMICGVREVIKNNRIRCKENGRPLLLHVSHPHIRFHFNSHLKNEERLEFFNASDTITESFYDKKKFHDFANTSKIYPKTIYLEFKKDNVDSLVEDFLKQSQAENLVIKPINGTRSEDVHILSRLSLLENLRQIKAGTKFPEARQRFLKDGMLIQECHLSKSIYYNKSNYLAKGRAFIRADFSENKNELPKITLVTGYWQIAKKPLDFKITDETAIANNAANTEGVLAIANDDWHAITHLFKENLPCILQKMYAQDEKVNAAFTLFKKEEKTLNTGSSKEIYERAMQNFFKHQVFIPSGTITLRRAYYWWNRYLSNNSNQVLVKKLIIDLVGVNPSFKANTIYNQQSLEPFIKDVMARAFGDNKNLLINPAATFREKSYYEAKIFLIYTAIGFLPNLMYIQDFSFRKFAINFLILSSIYLASKLFIYLNQSQSSKTFFFSKSKETVSFVPKKEEAAGSQGVKINLFKDTKPAF